jgi:hypothetical protein
MTFTRKLHLFSMAGLLLAASALHAGPFVAISNPDAAYLAGTSYIGNLGTPSSDVTSITDGTQIVTFWTDSTMLSSQNMNVREVGSNWGTWAVAPDSQRPDNSDPLPVLYSNGATSIFMALSLPSYVFGFEAEPNPFSPHDMTATFYGAGMTLLGSITRNVDGNAGSRLFAASADPISYVQFSSQVDYAVGAFRYSADRVGEIPEPGTIALVGLGLVGVAFWRRSRR